MATVMANHATILGNQSQIETALRHQHDCIEALKREVAEFRSVVAEIRDILVAMRFSLAVFKYVAIVGASIISAWHAVRVAWKAFWS